MIEDISRATPEEVYIEFMSVGSIPKMCYLYHVTPVWLSAMLYKGRREHFRNACQQEQDNFHNEQEF